MFKHLKVGDIAVRDFFGQLQPWSVTEVGETLVTIGMGWTFDRETGVEVDEDCPSISEGSRLTIAEELF